MKVSAQYAQEHFAELLETAGRGEDVEIARDGEPSVKLYVMPKPKPRPSSPRMLGAGVGTLELPSDEEWEAMSKELEDLMLNGPLFPEEKA